MRIVDKHCIKTKKKTTGCVPTGCDPAQSLMRTHAGRNESCTPPLKSYHTTQSVQGIAVAQLPSCKYRAPQWNRASRIEPPSADHHTLQPHPRASHCVRSKGAFVTCSVHEQHGGNRQTLTFSGTCTQKLQSLTLILIRIVDK